MGDGWRNLTAPDIDGAWGIAIVKSILDGVCSTDQPSWMLRGIAGHLGVPQDDLRPAFMRLSMNGVFMRDRIYKDRKALKNFDLHAWCQYAGLASGATGNVSWQPRKKNRTEHSGKDGQERTRSS